MKKRKVNALLAIVLSLTMLVGVTGCGKEQQLEAEINPDTPATEVQFPLKETAELSFITSAPATSTQEPNERVIFQRMEEQTNVHIGLVLYQISFLIRKIWHLLNLEIYRTDYSMQE